MRFPTAGFHFYTTIEFSWSDSTLCEKSKRKVFFFLAPSQVHTHAADFCTLIFYMGIQTKLIGISSSFLELKEENWLSNERRILCVCIQSKFLNVADPLRTKKTFCFVYFSKHLTPPVLRLRSNFLKEFLNEKGFMWWRKSFNHLPMKKVCSSWVLWEFSHLRGKTFVFFFSVERFHTCFFIILKKILCRMFTLKRLSSFSAGIKNLFSICV